MARKDVDINVNVDVNNAAGNLKSFSNTWTELSSAIGVVGGVAQTVIGTVSDMTNEYLDQAQAVRELSQFTGATFEETSRLLDVFADAGVEAQTLKTAFRYLAEQGLTPSVETIAQLSDEYNALSGETERVSFLTDRFGARGAELGMIFDQTGQQIREAGEAVSDSEIFDDEKIRQAEELRLAIENWNGSLTGLKNEAIGPIIEPMADLLNLTTDYIAAQKEATSWLNRYGIMFGFLANRTEDANMELARLAATERDAAMTAYYADQAHEEFNDTITAGELAFDQYNTAINNVKTAQDNATLSTLAARDANIAMFASINTGLDTMIQKWMDDYEWISNGGLLLQQQFESLKAAWAEPGADQTAIREDMDDLYAKTEALNVAIGKIDASQAAQNIADTLGVSIGEAYQLLNEFLASLAAGGSLNVEINYNDPGFTPSIGGGRGPGAGTPGRAPGGMQARAGGGPVTSGTPYIVGEEGPELFSPGQSGTIINATDTANALGGVNIAPGAIVVNGAGDPERVAQLVINKIKAEAARNRRSGIGSY